MKMKAYFMGYQEREYTSKKTGAPAVARELTVLTEDKQLLVFGYGSITREFDSTTVRDIETGTPIVLDVTITGDPYRRNNPRVIVDDLVAG